MTPDFAPLDVVDGLFVDAIPVGQNAGDFFTRADHRNLIFGEFRSTVAFSACGTFGMGFYPADVVTFDIPVSRIVRWGAEEQVLRINADRSVAAVKNPEPIRDWSMRDEPRNAVGLGGPSVPRHGGITVAEFATGPVPARIGLTDSAPKAGQPFCLADLKCHGYHVKPGAYLMRSVL